MFVSMFLGAWTLLHLYVFWRLSTVPFVSRHLPRKFLFPFGALLWASLLLRRFIDDRIPTALSRYLEFFDMNWLGILFLLFVAFLAVDVITLFGLLLRRHIGTIRTIGLAAGILLSAVALFQGLRPPTVTDHDIHLANLPPQTDSLVVAAMSDLHVGDLIGGSWLDARVEQINALNPDIIFLLGDIFEGDSQSERGEDVKQILQKLTARYGVWAVTGNHESHGGRDAGITFLESVGIHVLRNQWSKVMPGLAIGGFDDAGHWGPPDASSTRIHQVLAAKPDSAATIFLSHRPLFADDAANAGIGLMLSGHTHAGQIWPFTYIVASLNPYLAGEYEIERTGGKGDQLPGYVAGTMPLIVCRGTGTWGPRMRLWRPGEILRITVHRS